MSRSRSGGLYIERGHMLEGKPEVGTGGIDFKARANVGIRIANLGEWLAVQLALRRLNRFGRKTPAFKGSLRVFSACSAA